ARGLRYINPPHLTPLPLFPYYSVPPRHLHSFPTRRSSDLPVEREPLRDARDLETLRPRAIHRVLRPQGSRCAREHPRQQFLRIRSEEHTSELQSRFELVCRLLLEKTNFDTLNVRFS